ncbi:MAG: hypothetical protein ABI577_05365 [bacterium]
MILEKLKKPQYALPAAVVVGMLAIAFGIQPNGPSSQAKDISAAVISQSSVTPVVSTSTVAASKTAAASPAANTTPGANSTPSAQSNQQASTGSPTTTSDVAGARATPSVAASPTVDPALQRQPTQCGALQESTTAVSVEQSITGVSIKATKVAVYPVEYFRCILMATGGQEAYGLASSVNKAEEGGMTHIVLVDLWVANASKQFGQVNVKNATLAVAGQSFVPLATLGGRSEVVVSSGQGRNLSLVIAIKDNVGATTGPMTLIVEGPLTGGNPVAGKYQLFLPTP